jgi:hypothetical protein
MGSTLHDADHEYLRVLGMDVGERYGGGGVGRSMGL